MEEIDKNITKKVNLDANDGLSGYLGFACQQHHGVYEVFYNFLNEVKPSNILEIGTALGGFTQYLDYVNKKLRNNCRILSYDIHRHDWYNDMIKDGIDVRVENVFSEDFSSVKPEVIEFIKSPGTTIVFCDGGSKKDEFNILSFYLKQRDFILAHDYGFDRSIFEQHCNGKIWNWCEITESDISSSVVRNNLQDYNNNVFNNVAWTCKVKL
jgi:hypothetical protein